MILAADGYIWLIETLTKIFIGGFPLDINEMQLVQLVARYGEVRTIKIVRDKATRKCKGYAFIEMASKADADQVVDALDGTTMGDRELKVSIKVDEPAKPAPSFKRVSRGPSPDGKPRRPRLRSN